MEVKCEGGPAPQGFRPTSPKEETMDQEPGDRGPQCNEDMDDHPMDGNEWTTVQGKSKNNPRDLQAIKKRQRNKPTEPKTYKAKTTNSKKGEAVLAGRQRTAKSTQPQEEDVDMEEANDKEVQADMHSMSPLPDSDMEIDNEHNGNQDGVDGKMLGHESTTKASRTGHLAEDGIVTTDGNNRQKGNTMQEERGAQGAKQLNDTSSNITNNNRQQHSTVHTQDKARKGPSSSENQTEDNKEDNFHVQRTTDTNNQQVKEKERTPSLTAKKTATNTRYKNKELKKMTAKPIPTYASKALEITKQTPARHGDVPTDPELRNMHDICKLPSVAWVKTKPHTHPNGSRNPGCNLGGKIGPG